jgi:hypothetical protein
MRYEVWPAVIPFAMVFLIDVLGQGSHHFVRRLAGVIRRGLSLAVISAFLYLMVGFLCTRAPKSEYGGMSWVGFLTELAQNRHNLAMFACVPVAAAFWLVSLAGNVWPWSFIVAAAAVIFQPWGCVINDWMVRTVFARYLLLVGLGSVLSTGTAAWMSVPFVLAMLMAALYCYAMPIQEYAISVNPRAFSMGLGNDTSGL